MYFNDDILIDVAIEQWIYGPTDELCDWSWEMPDAWVSRLEASPTKKGQWSPVGAASCRETHPTEKEFGCKNVLSKQTTKVLKI